MGIGAVVGAALFATTAVSVVQARQQRKAAKSAARQQRQAQEGVARTQARRERRRQIREARQRRAQVANVAAATGTTGTTAAIGAQQSITSQLAQGGRQLQENQALGQQTAQANQAAFDAQFAGQNLFTSVVQGTAEGILRFQNTPKG